MRCASGSPVQLGIEGIRNRPIESADHPEGEEARPALDLAATAGEEREPEHEQQVADDRAGQRAADDLGQPLVDRDQGDDQLGRVAERGIEEAADPGPVCSAACSVASPISHASGISAAAARTKSAVSPTFVK